MADIKITKPVDIGNVIKADKSDEIIGICIGHDEFGNPIIQMQDVIAFSITPDDAVYMHPKLSPFERFKRWLKRQSSK